MLPGVGASLLNAFVWALLTCDSADLRDPTAALPLAQRAVEKSGGKDPGILDTPALAYFLTGDIAKAIEVEEKALSLLPPGDSQVRKDLEKNLARFRDAAVDEAATTQPVSHPPTTQPSASRPVDTEAGQSAGSKPESLNRPQSAVSDGRRDSPC